MCDLYRIRVSRWEYNDHFRAGEDAGNELVVEKDYVAPGKPGVVVRCEDAARGVSTM